MDFLKCVVNIPSERIALHSDVSFNASNETLNAQKSDFFENHITGNFLRPPDPSAVTELSTLQSTNNRDYLTLSNNL